MSTTVAALRIETDSETGAPIFIVDSSEGAVTIEAEDAAQIAGIVDTAAGDEEHTAERSVRQAVVDAQRVRVAAVQKQIEELEAQLQTELEAADAAEEALASIGGKTPKSARGGRKSTERPQRERAPLAVVKDEPVADQVDEEPPVDEESVDELPPTFGSPSLDDDTQF